MKVSYAAQTFSSSVASTMDHLMKSQHPDFINAGGSIEIARRLDRLFDILNSGLDWHGNNIYKRPITVETKDEIFSFLDDTADYLKGLSLEPFKNPLIDSIRKVGFKGMLINIANTKAIYNNFVQNGDLDQFSVRRICQCPLESLFGRCRSHSMLGPNTNPTISQFKSIMRKVVVNNEVTSSTFSNCDDQLDIWSISSRAPGNSQITAIRTTEAIEADVVLEDIIEAGGDEEDRFQLQHRIVCDENPSNEEIGIAHIAGQIDKRIEMGTKIKCNLCRAIIAENSKILLNGHPIGTHFKILC